LAAASVPILTLASPADGRRTNSGDQSVTPGTVKVTYADQTWIARASGPIDFREDGDAAPAPTTAGWSSMHRSRRRRSSAAAAARKLGC